MEIDVTWTETVIRKATIGINIENVTAAGLDPLSPDDMLEYVQLHMDRTPFQEQLGRYNDIVSVTDPLFTGVDFIDTTSRVSGVA